MSPALRNFTWLPSNLRHDEDTAACVSLALLAAVILLRFSGNVPRQPPRRPGEARLGGACESYPVLFRVQVHRAHAGSQPHPGKGASVLFSALPGLPASRAPAPAGVSLRLSGGPASAFGGPASCLLCFVLRFPSCGSRGRCLPPGPVALGHLKPCGEGHGTFSG